MVICVRVDCAKSGDFRSITHHFRTRRSADQQQTAAADEYDLQQQSDDAAAAAGLPHQDGATMLDEMMHMSQKMMDVVDVRIEGMEDMLHHLQTTVHQLDNKVSACTLRFSLSKWHCYCRIGFLWL